MAKNNLNRIIKESVTHSLSRLLSEKRHEALRKKLVRSINESDDVMKKYYGINTNHYKPIMVEHITIDRIMHKHGNNGFIIISANKSDLPPEINEENTKEMIKLIKISGYSYLPTYGGYHNTETGEDGDYEPSFIIFNYNEQNNYDNSSDFKELEDFGKFLCKKFDQDCFLCKRSDMPPMYLNRNGDKISVRETNKYWKNDPTKNFFSTFHTPEQDDKYGIGRRWTNDIHFPDENDTDNNEKIKEIYVNPIPCSLTERMRRKNEIMLY